MKDNKRLRAIIYVSKDGQWIRTKSIQGNMTVVSSAPISSVGSWIAQFIQAGYDLVSIRREQRGSD